MIWRLRRHNFCPGHHQKNLSGESNHIANVVMWPKFGNSNITTREVIITLILQRFIFEGCSWFKFNNLGLALGMALKFYTNVTKNLTVGKFRGTNSYVCRSYMGKTGRRLFCPSLPHPIPKRVKVKRDQEARENQSSFKMFKIIKFLKSWKSSTTTIVEVTLTTQKANACSLLDSLLFCCTLIP